MIKFICHPVLIELHKQSKVEMICQQSSSNIVIISDYYPQVSPQIHSGLIEAVKYRLTNPSCYIFITSFFSKEELFLHDTFGILSLRGTEFIRLPFRVEELYSAIEIHTGIELSIPKAEWVVFSTNACKALLKEKISVLKHEKNMLQLLSYVTSPLGGSCRAISVNPAEYTPIIKRQLQSVKQFISEELSDLIEMAMIAKNINNPYLQNVVQFADSLNKLKDFSFSSEFNVIPLLTLINAVDDSFDKIKNI